MYFFLHRNYKFSSHQNTVILNYLTSPSSVKTILVLTLNFFFKIFLASCVLVAFFFIFEFDAFCIKEEMRFLCFVLFFWVGA